MQLGRTIFWPRPELGDEEKQAVLAVLDSGQLSQGPVVEEFEARFAKWCGVPYAIAVSSGTAALHVAMLAHGIAAGDEVITSSMTFVASANAALFVGARPVLVDIDEATFCMDPNRVETAITPRTRAILPVHLYGHPAPMPELREIATRRGLLLIEDACQAHGAEIDGHRVGSLGDSAVFSFYPTKHVAAGEGGMLTTSDARVAERARLVRNHGASQRYRHEIVGYNFRASDVHAAIGLAQLNKVDQRIEARRAHAANLTARLGTCSRVVPPIERAGYRHVFHQYTVRVPGGRRDLQQRLASRGIVTNVYYPVPVHRQPLYLHMGYGYCDLPATERAAHEVLSLPFSPGLTGEDIAYMADVLTELEGEPR